MFKRTKLGQKNNRAVQPKKPHKKPKPRPQAWKKIAFISAMKGTGGVKAVIARNLGVAYSTISKSLEREDWQDVRELYNAEVEAGIDQAVETVQQAIADREDLAVASLNARWYLQRLRRQVYGDESTVKVAGGATPVKVVSANVHAHGQVPIEKLGLPAETMRLMLEAIDAKETDDAE